MTSPAPGRARVLLVDDEPDVLEALGSLFRRLLPNAEVLTAQTPERALQIVDASDASLLVVSDYNLGRPIDGAQLLAAVRARRPHATLVLASGYAREDIRMPGVADVAFLAKPFDIATLLSIAQEFLRVSAQAPAAAPSPLP